MKNLAFIDGQNLYMGTACDEDNPWCINLKRFRIYLKEKYKVEHAYYYLGFVMDNNQDLYNAIQEAGFILTFRKHNSAMAGKKKGNVDADIVFAVMKKMYKKEDFDNIVLVSGDGDYKMMVDFLIEEKRFEKILFPNRKFASSLYKSITREFYSYLEDSKRKLM
jgi:uncharacterized LabA/DUF88 family protein